MPPELGEGVRQAAARQGTLACQPGSPKQQQTSCATSCSAPRWTSGRPRTAPSRPLSSTSGVPARAGTALGCGVKAVLDAGALAAVDRRDRMTGARLRVLQQHATPVRVSSAVVGQVWRDGRKQANLARVLAGVGIQAPAPVILGKRIGELLALAGTADIVDAHVALMTAPADLVLTSDPGDIRKLLQARGVPARVQSI